MLGVRSMAKEWRLTTGVTPSRLYADASAALSIAKRQGAGKMRHINVKSLWLQEKALQALLADGPMPQCKFQAARPPTSNPQSNPKASPEDEHADQKNDTKNQDTKG